MTEELGRPSRGVLERVGIAAFSVVMMIVFLRRAIPLWMLVTLIAAFLAVFVFQLSRRR